MTIPPIQSILELEIGRALGVYHTCFQKHAEQNKEASDSAKNRKHERPLIGVARDSTPYSRYGDRFATEHQDEHDVCDDALADVSIPARPVGERSGTHRRRTCAQSIRPFSCS
jgi:hypothetical protein